MYNSETKEQFIENLKTDDLKRMYLSIFNRSKEMEQKANKDIHHFNVDECIMLLTNLRPKSIGHVDTLISQLKNYTEWGIRNSVSSVNWWGIVSANEDIVMRSFRIRYIKDPNLLEDIVETGLTVPFDKYVVYLLFMGIMGKNFCELTGIKEDNVHFSEGTVSTTRQKYDMCGPLKKLMDSSGYYEEFKGRDYNSPFFVKPFKTKQRKGEPLRYQYIHRIIDKLNRSYNGINPESPINITATSIWRSGLFYYLHEAELRKNHLSTDDYLRISADYGNKKSYTHCIKEYALYKKIFWE